MSPIPPFPFIVGCPRSGTTLLRAMVDSHPDVAIPGEAEFIIAMGIRAPQFADREGMFDRERFLRWLDDSDRFRRWGLPVEYVEASLDSDPVASLPDGIRRVFALFAKSNGKTRYGDKTPPIVQCIPLVASMFPEGRFVHIIRDGRDVALSVIDAPFGPTNVSWAAAWWKLRVLTGRRSGRELDPSRYREVPYEALVEDPEPVLRSLCEFLDLDFHPAMLEYPQRADEVRRTHGVTHPTQFRHLDEPPTAGIRNWRTTMQRDDLALFEAIAGDALSELGYERAFPAPPLTARLRGAILRPVAAARMKRASRRGMAEFAGPG